MAPAPNPNPSAVAAAANYASVGFWQLLAVAAPHIAALGLMLRTETDFGSRLSFLFSWAILNFFWIALLRRPALSGALSLSFVAVLVLLSRLAIKDSACSMNSVARVWGIGDNRVSGPFCLKEAIPTMPECRDR
jgi:hypothetical protein